MNTDCFLPHTLHPHRDTLDHMGTGTERRYSHGNFIFVVTISAVIIFSSSFCSQYIIIVPEIVLALPISRELATDLVFVLNCH